MSIALKAGYRSAEDRDEHGRWSATGTPGSTLLVRSQRLMGTNNTGDPLPIAINPRPPGMSRIMERAKIAGYLRSVTLDGGSVAVADAMKTTHQEIYDALADQAHPLLQTREQHHFATRGDNNLFINAGPNEPHWFYDRRVGVYNYHNRLQPAQWPPGMRQALIVPGRTKSTMTDVDLKAGFDPSQARDQQGRWSEGGGGVVAPTRLLIRTGELQVNPNPQELHRLLAQSPERRVHGLGIGDNIVVASNDMPHSMIERNLKESSLPLGTAAGDSGRQDHYIIDAGTVVGSQYPHQLGDLNVRVRGPLREPVDPLMLPAALRHSLGIQGDPPRSDPVLPWDDNSVSAGLRRWLTGTDVPPAGYLPKWLRPPPLRIRSRRMPAPFIRLSKRMDTTETKFNFDPAQPRDPSGKWSSGGGLGHVLSRIGNRLGRQPLPSGHVPHPHGQVWVNPSSARIVQFARDGGGIGSIARTGKNVILARGVPIEQAIDHVNNNLPGIIQTAEPELRHAIPQTAISGAPSALSRKRTLYINPSARNMASIFKKSKDGRVKTLIIGDNLVVGPAAPNHYDMVRILQRAGHPLGARYYESSH